MFVKMQNREREREREHGNICMDKHLLGVYTGGPVVFLLDLLRLLRRWVSSLRLVFFVIVVVVLPRFHCRRPVFPRAGSLSFVFESCSCVSGHVFVKIQNREKDGARKHMYGHHLPGKKTGGPLVFSLDLLCPLHGWVSSLRLVFFVIVVVVLPRHHCRCSVFPRAGSLAFFVDRVRASLVLFS